MAKLGSTQMLQFYIQWASIALLYYDYALTFGMEVKYVWNARFRMSTFLYICCRYALVANIIYLLTISTKLGIRVRPTLFSIEIFPSSCEAGYMISGSLSVLGRAAVIIIWTARTYAVFGRNRVILAFFAAIGLTCIILDVVSRLWHVPVLRCTGKTPYPSPGEVTRLLGILMVVFEACSVILNTFRTIQTLRIGGPWQSQKEGLIYLLLEHVANIRFSVVMGFTTAALVLNFVSSGGFFQRLLNAFTLPISGMITARFLLHLRMWEANNSLIASINPSRPIPLEFAANSTERGTRSLVDEFGEDPVQHAQEMHRRGLSEGESVDGFGEGVQRA
ncbi:hypothetical protein L208DRAFT_1355103 [Tricholoma matsutake]|nr:hypothetical protein L208DRAFT_1355103 [Tricholoma matsutake 945]